MKEENYLKRSNYKLFLFISKYLPYVLSLLYMTNTIFSIFFIDLPILSIIGGMSILPIIYILCTSFLFKYCIYHRLPIYYICLNDCINWLVFKEIIPMSDIMYIICSLLLIFVTIIITTILYLKEKKRKK